MADRLHPTALLGRRVWWLLDLTWAGQTIRISDAEIDVTTADGTTLHYAGVLDSPDVDEGIDFLADASSSPTSAALAAVLPVDVPKLIAQGHDLASATGTLARWVEGTTHEDRRVIIFGQVVDPEYGTKEEPVSFSLELTPWDDSTTIPSPAEAVIGDNWDSLMIQSIPSGGLGLAYPIVIGRPGQLSSSGLVAGAQGVYVDQRRTSLTSNFENVSLIVAGHHVSAGSVYMKTQTNTTFYRYRLSNAYDRSGHPVAVATWWSTKSSVYADVFVYDGAYSYTFNNPITRPIGCLGHIGTPASIQPGSGVDAVGTYVAWVDADDANAGGLSTSDGVAMREAGDVLEWLLLQSGIPVDRGRFAAVKSLLSRFRLDFTIDASVTPWEFARSNLLPILPVSIVSGPDGLYPVVWRYDATSADAVAHLDTGEDPEIERASVVSYDRSSIRNDISLNYALAVRTGQFVGTIRYSAEGVSDATPNLYCELSQRRYKRPDGSALVSTEVIESPCIYADSTAHAVLQWMAKAYALARRRVTYLARETVYGWLERGHIVTLTDADLHLSSQVAIVENIRTDGSSMLRVRLLLIEAPVRDSRLIS